jgi:hypothetical protein
MATSLLFGAVALTACLMPAQSDTYWHLRAGHEIWQTHHVSLIETYSFTARGSFWPNHEWLWQALSYALYRLGGMPLLTGVAALFVTAAVALAWRLTIGSTVTRFVLTVLGVPVGACVWALRPQVASLALLVLLVTLLAAERFLWLPLLFVVWANLHGSVAMGGAVLAGVAIAAIFRSRSGAPPDQRRARYLAVVTPVCAAATLATPLGARLWTFVYESIQRSRTTMIVEWMPAYPTGPVEIAFWVLTVAFLILLARRWRTLGSWTDIVVITAALVVLPLAMRAVRNIAPFLLLAIPAASRLMGPSFRWVRRVEPKGSQTQTDFEAPRLNLALTVILLVAGAGTVAAVWRAESPMLGWRPIGASALHALRACPGPLFNRYNDGGFLIWFAPERPVFIDSRQDPYPLAFVLDAVSSDHRGTPHALFARHGIRCAFLPTESMTVPALVAAGWRTRFRDAVWAILEAPEMSATATGHDEPTRP